MVSMFSAELENLNAYLLGHGIVHFSAKELTWINYLKKRSIPPEELWSNILPTLHFLEFARLKFGAIRVISGYRDADSNRRIPGTAKHSQHIQFRAVDSAPIKGNLYEYKRFIRKFYECKMLITGKEARMFGAISKMMGIGAYSWGVHVDFGYKQRIWGSW